MIPVSIACWVNRCGASKRSGVRAAIDGTGLSLSATSSFFIRRIEQHSRGMTRWSHWLKYLIAGDLDDQLILAQRARQAPWCDCRALPSLADAAARVTPIGLLLADAEFDTEANHQHIRQRLGARSIIPAKRGRSSRVGIRGQMRRHFPRRIYAQRAKVETIFSVIKRKLSARAPGRSLPTQARQALLLGLTFNFYRLRHPSTSRGCQQSHLKSLFLSPPYFRTSYVCARPCTVLSLYSPCLPPNPSTPTTSELQVCRNVGHQSPLHIAPRKFPQNPANQPLGGPSKCPD
ncbi:MAG: transposase [Candidatus Acidiferrales bacterium]